MKSVRMLILALGLMTIVTASSFAAVPFFTSSTVNIVPVNAQTGVSGSILYTALVSGTVSAGEIINVAYESPISMVQDIKVTFGGVTPLQTTGAISAYATAYQVGTLTDVNVTVNQKPINTLVISFGSAVSFAQGDQIQISGVRLDCTNNGVAIEGSNTTVFITNTTGQATVINPRLTIMQFQKPLDKPVISNPLEWEADGDMIQDTITITVRELITNAFDTRGAGNTTATRLQFEITNIPQGIAYSTAYAVDLDGVNTEIYSSASITNGRNIIVRIDDQDGNTMQRAGIAIQFYVSDASLLPVVWPSNFSVRAKLIDPYTGDYILGSSVPLTSRLRFKELWSDTATISGTIENLWSYLFSTYNEVRRVTGTTNSYVYDTGFAISNTSGSGVGMFDGDWFPGSQPGAIQVCLFPQAGGTTTKCFTTSSTAAPGVGLDANGLLGPRATWTVLLSDILKVPAINMQEFRGYVAIKCNFRGAQGISYIADGLFEKTAHGYEMWSSDNFLAEWNFYGAWDAIDEIQGKLDDILDSLD